MDKKERLNALIRYYSGGNKSKFAKKIGLTPQGLAAWYERGTFNIELLFSFCENVSPEWLITGEGEMLRPTSVSQTASGDHSTNVAGNGNNVAAPSLEKLIDEIAAQRKLTERAMEQNDKLTNIIQQLTAGNYDKV